MPAFGKTSKTRLLTCHALLQELCQRVVVHHDITVLCGHRSQEKQTAAYESGASSKPWPTSKHNQKPSAAVDIAPWPIPEGWGGLDGRTLHARDLDWKERVKFYQMISVVQFCWAQMLEDFPELADQWRLRLGADWDGDGDYRDQSFDDLPHVELVEVRRG